MDEAVKKIISDKLRFFEKFYSYEFMCKILKPPGMWKSRFILFLPIVDKQ